MEEPISGRKRLRIHPQLTERARQFRKPMTPMEERLWARLRGRGCGGFKFRRQTVRDRFITDFYCAEAKLAVEVDGASHNTTLERDAVRDKWLALHGYHTLRISNDQVRDHLEKVLIQIEQECLHRITPTQE
ncbi:MAG TPA: DUF559 domain-containing protein [Chthonomonadaceae bacterium]|nr:DUF559 domain-containing protein [Chthonomonadaceae bacterium]